MTWGKMAAWANGYHADGQHHGRTEPATSDLSRRLRLIFAYVCVLGISILIGNWLFDEAGRRWRPTSSFLGAGKFVLQGHAADAYNWELHKSVAVAESGATFDGYFPGISTDLPDRNRRSWRCCPIPPRWCPGWRSGQPAHAAAIRLIAGHPPCRAGSPGLAAGALEHGRRPKRLRHRCPARRSHRLDRKRPALAGICFGLLTYKPQFGRIIPLALIAGGYWRVIGWAAISATAMIVLSIAVFGTRDLARFLRHRRQDQWHHPRRRLGPTFPSFKASTALSARWVAVGAVAWIAQGLLIAVSERRHHLAVASKGLRSTLRRQRSQTATILASPYAFIYDFVALAIPLMFLGKAGFSTKESAVVIAAGILVGYGPSQHVATALSLGAALCWAWWSAVHARIFRVRHASGSAQAGAVGVKLSNKYSRWLAGAIAAAAGLICYPCNSSRLPSAARCS